MIVLTKLIVLAGIALIGVSMFSPNRLSPLDNQGLLGVFLGAGVIFVAYEGFELLPYDYDDIAEPRRTLPRALYLSVAVVIAVYVVVTVASQMLLPGSDDHRPQRGRVRDRRPEGSRRLRPMGSDGRGRLLHKLGDQRDAVRHRAAGP